ncbi:MAG TPA: class I SAM-dependent rRNA methyltransferase [Smithellaceae bacterium]|nr:class I SAM-dependent rRNA methyltransferase [Smithellaceae bacterium]HRS88833.1 class I SAM-dependent rRNA methyltransferase [Smithellaceae bacterium]HRV25731.1 class I SAM-dependent rRNA methyltransferase [Smithellaceae bacterium]
MTKSIYPEITLKKGRDEALRRGHPWVFSRAVEKTKGEPAAGDVVLCRDCDGRPLALGFFHPRTDIAFRVLTRQCDALIDAGFWSERVKEAFALRKKIINEQTNAYRLINAEGDGFPGLITDVYAQTIIVSVTTAGMEKQKGMILQALMDELKPQVVYERSEGRSRQLEGLSEAKGFLYGESRTEVSVIRENGKIFEVDFVSGQKTGFFLDQRVNREKLGEMSSGARVLNCFSYSGAFSAYCAAGGATRVVSVDVSSSACRQAEKNLKLNGFSPDHHPVIEADVFAYLRGLREEFDLIILDPPAFAKTKADLPRAARGYKEINMQAVKNLPRGGLLATFSCSNYLEEDLFYKIVLSAARDVNAQLQILERLGPGPDHPVLLGHPEGSYLKGLLLVKK